MPKEEDEGEGDCSTANDGESDLSFSSSIVSTQNLERDDCLDDSNTCAAATTPSDEEGTKLFTPVVLCILVTETAERFSYFGFRAILVLYFKYALHLEDNTAISCFAYTTFLANFSPILGALVAEKWGRFSTILCFGILYAFGLMVLTQSAFLATATAMSDDEDSAAASPEQQANNSNEVEEEDSMGTLFWKRSLTTLGLVMVSIGTGGIKPCVNIFGADQVALRDRSNNNHPKRKTPTITSGEMTEEEEEIIGRTATTHTELEISSDDDPAVREFFNFFYFCINVGAVTSFVVIPFVKRFFGFGVAFLLPTVFMWFAIGLFYSRRKQYIYRKTNEDDQDSSSLATTFQVCFELIFKRAKHRHRPLAQREEEGQESFHDEQQDDNHSESEPNKISLDESSRDEPSAAYEQAKQDAQEVMKILPIMAMLPTFWLLYDQQGSVWTLQASRMALHGLEPEQMNCLNPLEIMVFIPLFDRIIYPAMETNNWNIAPLRRMGWGMVLASISFITSGILEHVVDLKGNELVSIFWMIPQITIMAIGEIFLSVTGLEYAYSRSPDRLKGFIMASYLLTIATGDLVGGILYSSIFRTMDRATVMFVCAFLMLLNRFIFGRVVAATQQNTASDPERCDDMPGGNLESSEQHEPYLDSSETVNNQTSEIELI